MTPLPPPPPDQAQVWIDFDGTMTQSDLLDDLIARWSVDDSWKQVENLWLAGEIGSRECLRRQFDLVRIGDQELEAFLDRVRIDPGLLSLMQLLERFCVPHAVLSDGVDRFIRRTLAPHKLDLVVRSNAIERAGQAMRLVCPLQRDDCDTAAAHCKCGSMQDLRAGRRKAIYIGDGRSDLCPARKADFVFAKGALAEALKAEGKAFVPFTTLADVTQILQQAWDGM